MVSVDDRCRVSRETTSLVYVDTETNRAVETGERLEADLDVVVEAATDVNTVLSILEEHEFECLITTEKSSDGDGLSLVRAVRRRFPQLPIIFAPLEGSETLASEAIEAGVSAYVPSTTTLDGTESGSRLETLSAKVSTVLDQYAEDRFRDVDAMHDVAIEFETCNTEEGAYQLAVDAMVHVLESDASALYIERDGLLWPSAVSGDIAEESEPYGLDEGVVGRTYQHHESSIANNIEHDHGEEAKPIDDTIRAGISIPVGTIGVLQAVSSTPGAFSERDMTLAELLAAHVSAAISRIRSERAVRRERDRFAALFENVPDGVVFTGEVGNNTIVDVNPAFESMFGFDREALLGNSLDSMIVPDDDDPVDIYETAGLDSLITREVTRLTANGPREFLGHGFAIELEDTIHEYAIYTDITERKQRERELEQYHTLVETVGDPMYILGPEGTIDVVNDAMVDALGVSRRDVVGQHVSQFLPEESVEEAIKTLSEILTDDEQEWGTFELEFMTADSEPRVVEANVAPITDDGEMVGSVGVFRDIGDRKRRERRIRALHDGTRQLMAAADAEEVAHVGCSIATEVLDYKINGVHWYDEERDALVPVAVSEHVSDVLGEPPVINRNEGLAWDAFEAGEPMAHGDVRFRDGVRNPETSVKSEAHLPLGEYGVLVVASTERNDFDRESLALANILAANIEAAMERAEREGELEARRAELERQNNRLESFAGTVSHDLRNPITLATGHLELALEAADDPIEGHLEEVDWALGRMNDLIDDVLALARSGKELSETEAVDLKSVTTEAARTVDPDLAVSIDDSLPTIQADRNRLLVLFENLFRNSIEHGGEAVTVTVGPTSDGFYVADDGPGIPENEREKVLESGYTTHPEGTGFGLAIVSEVVDAHDWSISIANSDAGGARFDIDVEGRHSDRRAGDD
ncbi:PAS domain S-box protein [Natronosalvus amylolyticus]|uniref:PAS domain S-box protein n=1 Tax=Natronosalvus amylolyticus TaxID=2961994 RepID=UPI0020C9F3B0|nr:PAS domain S-box protein [Natronosalvus amylolyticus]